MGLYIRFGYKEEETGRYVPFSPARNFEKAVEWVMHAAAYVHPNETEIRRMCNEYAELERQETEAWKKHSHAEGQAEYEETDAAWQQAFDAKQGHALYEYFEWGIARNILDILDLSQEAGDTHDHRLIEKFCLYYRYSKSAADICTIVYWA